ncbi:MAG: hypothetical protein OEQ53_08935 [Saprospiraceae bacterium]|nr:hypothetical protein [Saprospiraceae bacterium]
MIDRLLYNVIIHLYGASITVASLFSPKARSWRAGRKEQWRNAARAVKDLDRPIWIHCASLGEFEQGRSIIESIKNIDATIPILLTFFSPSGYSIRKNYPCADQVLYIPLDTVTNAHKFIDLINPRMAIFVKYDFWFNILLALHNRNIPFLYISVTLKKNHFLLHSWASNLLNIVAGARHIFVQDLSTANLLQTADISQVSVVGDTRVDRVVMLQNEAKSFPLLIAEQRSRQRIVFGSVWPSDIPVISSFLQSVDFEKFLVVVAPHDISRRSLDTWSKALNGHMVLFSQLSDVVSADTVLVDTMGDLAYLYTDAVLAYVGGGFDQGIHSILEPAAALVPLLFGPKHTKFKEAFDLIRVGVAQIVTDADSFQRAARYYLEEADVETIRRLLMQYLEKNLGATEKIMDYLVEEKLLYVPDFK